LTRLWLSGLALALGAFIAAASFFRPQPPPLPGTSLDGIPAPEFRLTDHRGVELGLTDFRGKPIVLAFLYTNCPDVCKLTAAGLRQTLDRLGADAPKVQLVAVSVEPKGDDAASVRRFLGRYEMLDRMVYLNGPAEALPAVWQSYYLYVEPTMKDEPHTDALFLLDKVGRQRSLLRSDFDPDELAAALRILISEPR
jgi:protein SCO1